MAADKVEVYGAPQSRSFRGAVADIVGGLRQFEYWHHFAANDVRARYRRSILGEFWIGVSLTIFVLSIGVFYAILLNLDLTVYLPHLTVGYTF